MISKEKLIGGYVMLNDMQVVTRYAEACEHYGIEVYSNTVNCGKWSYLNISRNSGKLIKARDNDGREQLTLADFKPKTKVEYVHINANDIAFWEVAKEFAELDFCAIHFLNVHDDMIEVACNEILLSNYKSRNLYRKVETELTWMDELADKYPVHIQGDIIELTVTEFHKDTFAEMCSFVHDANK